MNAFNERLDSLAAEATENVDLASPAVLAHAFHQRRRRARVGTGVALTTAVACLLAVVTTTESRVTHVITPSGPSSATGPASAPATTPSSPSSQTDTAVPRSSVPPISVPPAYVPPPEVGQTWGPSTTAVPAPTGPTQPVPPTLPPALAAEAPTIYGVLNPMNQSASSAVVAVSPITGKIVRTVATVPGSSNDYGQIWSWSLSPDRSEIFAQVSDGGTCGSWVDVAPISGGPLRAIFGKPDLGRDGSTDSGDPVASPDGTRVLWRRGSCPPGLHPVQAVSLVLGDTSNGSSQTIDNSSVAGAPFSWGGSGGNQVIFRNTTQGVENVVIVTMSANGQMGPPTVLNAPDAGCSLQNAAFVPGTDLVAAVEKCGAAASSGNRIVELNERTGALTARLVTVAPKDEITGFSFDRTGQWLMYVIVTQQPDSVSTAVDVVHSGTTYSLPAFDNDVYMPAW